MSKLTDLFVDWTKRKRRWPLLMILLVPAYFAFFQKFYGLQFRQVLDNKPFLWLSGLTIAVSALGYVLLSNYERIIYSTTLDRLRRGRRVTVTKPLAWQRLKYDDGTGEETNVSIIREIARMLDGLGIRPVAVLQASDQKVSVGPRDEFAIHGVISPVGTLLRSVVMLQDPGQAMKAVERFMHCSRSGDDTGPEARGSVPWHRIFDLNSSLIDMYVSEIQIASSVASGERTALTRVFLQHALMTMLYRDEHDEGKSIAKGIIDAGMLLSNCESPPLAKIYKAVTVNLLRDGDLQQASRALSMGSKFAPGDPSLLAAQVLLHLKLDRVGQIAPLLATLDSKTNDAALLAWLKADHLMALNQPDEAIAPFERAITLEPDEEHRATLHFNTAFAYAMAGKLSSRQQGDGMIRHLEDAIHQDDNPVYHALKGYGWALRGDASQFEVEYGKVTLLLESMGSAVRELTSAFVKNWKARGLRKLGRASEAAECVQAISGPISEATDVANLLVLAGASLDQAGIKGDPEHLAAAERYIDRVIELDPSHGEAHKYRALVCTLRAEHTSDADERARLDNRAREDFLKSIRFGHELPDVHAVLARLYERNGDPVNAAKHRQRWLDLSPSSPEANAYQALSLFDREGDLAGAKLRLDAIQGGGEGVGTVYRLLAAQAAGNEKIDKSALVIVKECLLKAIELGDRIPATYNLLACVLADLSDLPGAIKYKRQVVALQPDDGEALLSLGELLVRNREFADARKIYRRALTPAPNDVEVVRRQADAWQAAGQLKDVAEAYANWLKIEPDSDTANGNLAFALFDLGQHATALEHWQRALQASPQNADSLAGKAAALHVLGRHDEARASYLAAVSANPDFLDEATMRTKYLWSDAAINAVRDDITAATQGQGIPR
jgi:tetratricopeptide (TPR) repeat protein